MVGKTSAVPQTGRFMMSSLFPWLVWASIHIRFLAEGSLRFSVFLQWAWTYLSAKRGDRLIIEQRPNARQGVHGCSTKGNLHGISS